MVMAVVIPQTDLILLKCPLEEDQQNQLTFTNETAQYNYFSQLPSLSGGNDFTYQRKDGRVRFNADIEDIRDYNYCMYRNDAYSNKWFYCFITNMEYANDGVTFLTLKTDVWQTWQFQLNFQNSFVEREHVNSDGVGEHTVPENLDYGEYVANKTERFTLCNAVMNATACMQVTTTVLERGDLPEASRHIELPSNETTYGGIPQGCQIYGFDLGVPADVAQMHELIGLYDTYGKADAILSIFVVTTTSTNWISKKIEQGAMKNQYLKMPQESYTPKKYEGITVPKVNNLNGYTPKNNKLFTYPYYYLYLSNNSGSDIIYHYEDFINNTPTFVRYESVGQGGCLFLAPENSKKNVTSGTGDCWNEGINLGKLPQLSWTSNYYLNWEAVNAANIQVQTTLDALGFVSNLAEAFAPASARKVSGSWNMMKAEGMAEGIGGTIGLARSVANTMQQIKQAKMIPDQARGNTNAGEIAFSNGEIGYRFTNMCVRYEYAKMLDDYFSMFGYKVNSLKTPNITGRTNWNYVKTVICNVIGNIPQADIEEIKALFNTGITFWHNPSTYLDYSQTNAII